MVKRDNISGKIEYIILVHVDHGSDFIESNI